jgi:hypothetical protein
MDRAMPEGDNPSFWDVALENVCSQPYQHD